MPEFHIDLGDMPATYAALDQFTQAYIEAAFWTESGETDSACYEKTFADLAPVTLARMVEDCQRFMGVASTQLEKAYECETLRHAYDVERAGHDFWLTRNGHGAGFWDRGLGQVGDDLSTLAKHEGSCALYCGDDGLIYCC